MKKLLAASLLLGVLAGATAPAAQAQTTPAKTKVKKDKLKTKADDSEQPDAGRGGRGPGNRLAEMTKELSLTSEQQASVAAIWQEQVQQLQAQRSAGGTEDRAARMQQLRALEESTDAKLKAVLTPEQFQQYQAKKQQRQRMGPPPGGSR
jgi:periplasmic protein CpxP/Spy